MSSRIAGRAAAIPRAPARIRAVAIMAGVGIVTGLISSLRSPLPDISLQDPNVIINAAGVPLHAGIVFGAALAVMLWLWVSRDLGHCLLAMAFTILGWLAAVNTADEVIAAVMSSDLFGSAEGAKASREVVGWVLGGLVSGGIGAGLTTFGIGIAASAIRRPEAWALIVVLGGALGLLLAPAAHWDLITLLFVPWQAAIAAAIAYVLTRHPAG